MQTPTCVHASCQAGLVEFLVDAAQSVLSWQRARAASLLASDGRAWTRVIGEHNSGTGNNQWMVRHRRGRKFWRGGSTARQLTLDTPAAH